MMFFGFPRRSKGRLFRLCLIVFAGIAAVIPVRADAQLIDSTLTLYGRPLAVTPTEQTRLLAVAHVLRGTDRAAQDRALAAAEAVASSADALYLLATYKLEIGRQRQDDALRLQALDVLIPSDKTPAERLPNYLAVRGDIAFRNHDYATASAMWGRLVELQPNDAQSLINLAQVRNAMNDSAGAADLIRRAIAARTEAGPASQNTFRQWVSITYNASLRRESAEAAQALVAAYPTPGNWRFALVAYRQLAAPQEDAEIDLLRLMRAVGALARAAEYQRFAQLLVRAGAAAEARAVLDEGRSRRIDGMAQSPTPEISREIDRALAQPTPPPARTVDSASLEGRFRVAVAQAVAGHRAEAEAGFRALAESAATDPGQRFYPDLARFWLVWLARSG